MAKGGSSKYLTPESDSESDYSSSSDDVEEDEFGEELTPALDAAILQTLGKIKRKEGVYGGENVLQEALKEAEKKAGALGVKTLQKVVAEKPYLLADHHRAALLNGGVEDENMEEEAPLTNVQEQRKLREGAISAFKSLAGDDEDADDEEEGFVLKERKKDDAAVEGEDEEYRKFLLDMGGGEDEVRKILGMGDAPAWKAEDEVEVIPDDAGKKKKKKKEAALSKVEKEEMEQQIKAKKEKNDDDFLMNYILNRGWIDRSEQRVPTYDQVVGQADGDEDEDEGENAGESSRHPWGVLDEDEFDEQADEFETAYNFRFEEPGSSNILSHPREIPSLVRRADDTRKNKRQAREERKAAEKAAEEEKTRRLKGQKRREMEGQIKALKAELGEDMDWTAVEKIMEGDWDENEWERVISTMLNQAADREDQGKPSWDDLGDAEYDEEDDGEAYDQYAYGGADDDAEMAYEEAEEEDGPINMDADFEDEQPKKSKKDKKSKKGKERAISIEPDLTPAERAQKVKETMAEYKALDHEDMIGDLATRFKYTQSAPVNFGLTPVEILLATDAELNALAGVRHIAPYRRGGLGKTGQGLSKRIRELKGQLRARRWGEEELERKKGQHQPKGPAGSGSNVGEMGKKRKWGEGEVKQGEGANGASGEKKAGSNGAAGGGSHGPKKRLGKKQRMKLKLAEEATKVENGNGQPSAAQGEVHSEVPVAIAKIDDQAQGDGEGKKKRRKKKKSAAGEERD